MNACHSSLTSSINDIALAVATMPTINTTSNLFMLINLEMEKITLIFNLFKIFESIFLFSYLRLFLVIFFIFYFYIYLYSLFSIIFGYFWLFFGYFSLFTVTAYYFWLSIVISIYFHLLLVLLTSIISLYFCRNLVYLVWWTRENVASIQKFARIE